MSLPGEEGLKVDFRFFKKINAGRNLLVTVELKMPPGISSVAGRGSLECLWPGKLLCPWVLWCKVCQSLLQPVYFWAESDFR